MKSYCRVLPLLFGLSACATRPALTTGKYVEDPGPGVLSFESRELRRLPGQRFEYFAYSDDISSSKHGAGTYELRGKQLRLTFDGQPLGPAAQVQTRPGPATHPDSLTFQVRGSAGRDAPQPLAGATILVRSTMQGTSVGAAGRATLRLARTQDPQEIVISCVGWQMLRQPWPAQNTAYEVYLQAEFGDLYAAGTVKEFRVLRQTANRLVLRRGNNTTTLALQAPK
ncbi:hypothetical protein [uncultured Hymenobacter sp.]|uniref:hypothetical protein n=1 Tax=uncultured Hymenobacter sp. TaxID=170016 RepID=UPI0035CB1976